MTYNPLYYIYSCKFQVTYSNYNYKRQRPGVAAVPHSQQFQLLGEEYCKTPAEAPKKNKS
jgi:hypothetical protein